MRCRLCGISSDDAEVHLASVNGTDAALCYGCLCQIIGTCEIHHCDERECSHGGRLIEVVG